MKCLEKLARPRGVEPLTPRSVVCNYEEKYQIISLRYPSEPDSSIARVSLVLSSQHSQSTGPVVQGELKGRGGRYDGDLLTDALPPAEQPPCLFDVARPGPLGGEEKRDQPATAPCFALQGISVNPLISGDHDPAALLGKSVDPDAVFRIAGKLLGQVDDLIFRLKQLVQGARKAG